MRSPPDSARPDPTHARGLAVSPRPAPGTPPVPVTPSPGARVSLFRKTVTADAPTTAPGQVPVGLVSLVKTAAVSLEKTGLTGQRAAVYLALDHSGSMTPFYRNGSVQHLAEQALGLSANLDDDGTVPIVYFGSFAEDAIDSRLDNYAGIIDRTHPNIRWGSTDYAAAMRAVISEHQ